MLQDALKTSEDKRDMTCKQNGWKSKICQVYEKEVEANLSELRNSGCDGKPAFKPVAEDCAMLRK